MDAPDLKSYVSELVDSLPDEQQKLLVKHFAQLSLKHRENRPAYTAEVVTFLVEKGMYYQQAAQALVAARDVYNEEARIALEGKGLVAPCIGITFESGSQHEALSILMKVGKYAGISGNKEPNVKHTVLVTHQPQFIAPILDMHRHADGSVDMVAVRKGIATRLPERLKAEAGISPDYQIAMDILKQLVYVTQDEKGLQEDKKRLGIITNVDYPNDRSIVAAAYAATLDARQSLFYTDGSKLDAWKQSALDAITAILRTTDPKLVEMREQLLDDAIKTVNSVNIRKVSRFTPSVDRFMEAYDDMERDLRKQPFTINAANAALILYFESLSLMVQNLAMKQQRKLLSLETESHAFYEKLKTSGEDWRLVFAAKAYSDDTLRAVDPFQQSNNDDVSFAWNQLGSAMNDYCSAAVWLTQEDPSFLEPQMVSYSS
jgi:hypothetical protein